MSNQIEAELTERLKAAMRAKDTQVLDVIRAIRSKVSEARTAEGFKGEVDDALYLQVIANYSKAMAKALEQFEAAGDKGAEMADKLRFEIKYLAEFLPTKLDEAQTRALVQQIIADTGATSRKEMGRVMGTVMKTHKDQVDATLVRTVVEQLLP